MSFLLLLLLIVGFIFVSSWQKGNAHPKLYAIAFLVTTFGLVLQIGLLTVIGVVLSLVIAFAALPRK